MGCSAPRLKLWRFNERSCFSLTDCLEVVFFGDVLGHFRSLLLAGLRFKVFCLTAFFLGIPVDVRCCGPSQIDLCRSFGKSKSIAH